MAPVNGSVTPMSVVTIRGFDRETDDGALRQHCSSVGKVMSLERIGKQSATVTYANANVAQKAAQKLDKSVVDGNERFMDAKVKGGGKGNNGNANSNPAMVKREPGQQGRSAADKRAGRQQGQVANKPSVAPALASRNVKQQPQQPQRQQKGQQKGTSPPYNAFGQKAQQKGQQKWEQKGQKGQQKGQQRQAQQWQAQPAQQGDGMAKVLITGWDFETEEQDIKNHVKTAAGRFASFELKSKASAFVWFKTHNQAQKAVEMLDQSIIEGNTRYIKAQLKGEQAAQKTGGKGGAKGGAKGGKGGKTGAQKLGGAKLSKMAQPKKRQAPVERSDGKTCFVRGYDAGTSEEDLLEYVGAVCEIKSHKFQSGGKRLFVTFETKEDAAQVIEALNKTTIPGNERYIDVLLHEKKDQEDKEGKKKQKTGKGKERKEKGPSGPDLPRERITTSPVTGTVLSFKGAFGWVKPDEPFEHEMAEKHAGKIYLHKNDCPDGALEKGESVQFEIYLDTSGLGAEEVEQL